MDVSFWVGLALGFVLSIIANLFTPAVQQWLGGWFKGFALRRTRTMKTDYELVKTFRANRSEFHEYLLLKLIGMTSSAMLAVLCVFGCYVYAVSSGLSGTGLTTSYYITNTLFAAIAMWNSATVLWTSFRVGMVSLRIKHFDAFEERVMKTLVQKAANEG